MESLAALTALWVVASVPLGFGIAALTGRNRTVGDRR